MVGSLALERFRLEEHLGSGSFGSVHRAWDLRLQRPVAIKAVSTEGGASALVMREAQAAARLSHPNIVTLYELGQEDGVAYLVTELVEGETLREAIDRNALTDREIAELGADLCEALDHAHARGVIHRDLKPANILISEGDGLAKLMDFGVASLSDQAGITATGDVVGTLAYMSPEQAEGRRVGPETDVYSLCLVLYECFSGENPNRRRSPAATVRAIGAELPPLARLRPDLPESLCAAIDLGLEPDAQDRIEIERLGPALERALPHLADRPAPHQAGTFGSGLGNLVAALSGRLGYTLLLAIAALAALALDRPGTVAILLVACLPPALFCRNAAGWIWIAPSAPVFGLIGLGSLYPAIAGLAPRWRDRLVLALSGCLFTAAIQASSGRDLGLGELVAPPAGWSRSVEVALADLLLPLATDPNLWGIALVWSAAALLVGLILAPFRAWTGRRAVSRRMSDGSVDAETDPRTPLSRSR